MELTDVITAHSRRYDCAFTRVDLLVVLLTLAVLFLMLFPALARTHVKPQETQCLDNLRQLALAWDMYAGDNNGKIMSNPIQTGAQGQDTTLQTWVNGYLSWSANNPDNTNSSLLTSALMGPYVNRQFGIFKCPSDYWKCFEGGQQMDRVRSYSINYCMEGDANDARKIAAGLPLDQVYWGRDRYGYRKLTDLGARLPGPVPADAWVLCDEHPDTINDGALAWGSYNPITKSGGWADMPASYHNFGDNFSFADGHVEYHNWLSGFNPKINAGICVPVTQNTGFARTGLGNPVDMAWVTSRGAATYP